MQKLHKEILTPEQRELLEKIKEFQKDFGLVGGTAIALQIGHRKSIDFDLFTKDPCGEFDTAYLQRKIKQLSAIKKVVRDTDIELTLITNKVQITFFHYPYSVPFSERIRGIIDMPNVLTLAAMKAFALGKRAKWKDYVDVYFIMRDHHPFEKIVKHARTIYGNEFNERLFRQQLSFFDDVNYDEKVAYQQGNEVEDEEVKRFLEKASIS